MNPGQRRLVVSGSRPRAGRQFSATAGAGAARRSPSTRGSARRDRPAASFETRGLRAHADRRAVRPPPRLLDADSTARPDVPDGERIALHPRAGTRRVETERRETHLRVIGVVTRHRARVDDTERCVSTQHERRARGTGEWRSYAGRGCFTSFHLLPSQTPHEYESKNSVNIYAFYRDCLLAYMRAHFRSERENVLASREERLRSKTQGDSGLDSRVTRDTRDTLTTLGDHPRLRSWSRTARPTWR